MSENQNQIYPIDAPFELPEGWAGVLFREDTDTVFLALPYEEHEDGSVTVPGWAIVAGAVYRSLSHPIIQAYVQLEMLSLVEDLDEAGKESEES